jgi:hypothetical protein
MTTRYPQQPAAEEALILFVIPESRSDIRDPATLHFNVLHEKSLVPGFRRDDE